MAGFVNYDVGNDGRAVFSAVIPIADYSTVQTGYVDCNLASNRHAKSVTFLIHAGVTDDGTVTFAFDEDNVNTFDDDLDTVTNPVDGAPRIFGTVPSITTSNDVALYVVTVIPHKRFLRISSVESVSNTGILFGVTAMATTD